MLVFYIITLLFALTSAQYNTTTIQTCNNNAPLPLNVEVTGCPTPPCTLIRGDDVDFYIIFKNTKLTQTLTAKATAYLIFGIDYPLEEASQACLSLLNTYCPLMAEEVVMYKLVFHIDNSFPATPLAIPIEFYLENDDSEVVTCLRLGVIVGNPA